MKVRSITFTLLIFLSFFSFAQKHTLSGYVTDAESGESLIGVTIYVEEMKAGTVTNVYGFYSLTIPEGTYNITYSFIGFQAVSEQIELTQSFKKNIELGMSSEALKEVVIEAEADDHNIRSTEMSSVKMSMAEIRKLPVLFGEVDVLKTITLMPGVQAAGEGNTGFYVRGGGPDQNLILLDGAPVYNASHLGGFFSVFNADAIKDITLMKGGIPSQYGGRLSSVLDIKMSEGNQRKTVVKGGIGVIASRLTIESPFFGLTKDKASFIVSGRRTYADMFLKLSSNPQFKGIKLYFYDLSAKVNYKINDNNRVFLSGYFGRDVFNFSDSFGFDWGNRTGTLRWNHLFNDKLFMNTSVIYSDYNYDFSIKLDDSTKFVLSSGIRDYNLKADLQYFPNTKNNIRFGANVIHHTFIPGEFDMFVNDSSIQDFSIIAKKAFEYSLYIGNDHKLTDKISANYGVRWNSFSIIGPGEEYTYEEDLITDTVVYEQFEFGKTYSGFEPRISVNYTINSKSSVKASYNRMRQNVHLLSPSSSGTPVDLWLPTTSIIAPEISDQVALGYFRNFKKNRFESSIEIYYKDMQNQIDYKPGTNVLLNPTVESDLLFGRGTSYGAEFLIRKKKGNFTGWVGYTLARTERKYETIDNGEVFPSRYDRTHDVSVVASYTITERLTVAATWVYNTGNAVTFPSGKYQFEGETINFYTEKNGYRMPAYHRADLSITLDGKKREKFGSSWNLSIYNIYNKKNVYSITFRDSETNKGTTEAVRLSLFGIVPAITWNFKF
ncbi:MAG: TonB-dependent receptor [Flavobacteriales bacterium]|nr:TonB-dependent receptor [Flavobacteriales bacterium]